MTQKKGDAFRPPLLNSLSNIRGISFAASPFSVDPILSDCFILSLLLRLLRTKPPHGNHRADKADANADQQRIPNADPIDERTSY